MLSILIPIYNQDVTELVTTLNTQCSTLDIEYEIICLDDGSERPIRKLNKPLSLLEFVTYKEVAINVGRSRIRNLLAERAKYQFLLFLDCDSLVADESFIQKYVSQLPTAEQVLVGGRQYEISQPSSEFLLHWLVGTKREQRIDSGFQSNNFLIPAKLFSSIKFSEQLSGYGHEDTLFGHQLAQLDITIKHIDNPVIHATLEPAEAYVNKQENAILNLLKLSNMFPDLNTRLLDTARKVEQRHLSSLLLKTYKNFGRRWRMKLLGPKPNLLYLDLYKLGYYLKKKSELQNN